MKILAIIPARRGSKRLPGKNLKKLGKKPLISWTIDLSVRVNEISDVLVSTDDERIARIARDSNVLVPWLRPKHLATDTATSVDAVLHALNWYEIEKEPVDGIILMQPTSPFRTLQTVKKGIQLFKSNNLRPVVSVTLINKKINSVYKLNKGFLKPFDLGDIRHLDDANFNLFSPNGLFYMISSEDIKTRKSFYGLETIPLIVKESKETIDIDTEWDFKIAQKFFD